MGTIQNSFNQLLTTALGASAAGKHLSQQKEILTGQALSAAEHSTNLVEDAVGKINELNTEIKDVNKQQANLEEKGTKLEERRAEAQANMEAADSPRSRNAYQQQINQQTKALQGVNAEYEKIRGIKQGVKERISIIETRKDIAQANVDYAKGKLAKAGINIKGFGGKR